MARVESAIAKDPTETGRVRRAAAFALLRQLRPPLSLADIGRALDRPNWLSDRHISFVHAVGGKLPVQWSDADTIVAIRVFPDLAGEGGVWTAYLRVEGQHPERSIRACLRNGGGGPASKARVAELALSGD
ncbi:MAG: hypothetical protein ACRDY0_02660 [Acidimicrobiales bacterium]